MTHNTDPSASLPQPDLHFEYAGSRIYLYNAQDIATAEPDTLLRLYEGTELPRDIQAATLDARVVTTDAGPVLSMETNFKLADQASWAQSVRRLQEHVKTERLERGYLVQDTLYEDVVSLELGMGMRALAYFDEQGGRVTARNYVQLGKAADAGGYGVVRSDPVLLERLGASLQIMTMSRFLVDVLSYARWPTPTDTPEYRIGERVTVLSRPGTQVRLGGIALAASELASPAPPTDEEVLAAVERELAASIDDTVRLDEVAGNAELKNLLRDVARSFKHADVMAQWGVRRPQGVLLYGDPGTGKTMLIEALANEIDAELRRVQGSDIYGKWLGESEANIKRLFTELRTATRPTVVFFDEIEAIIGITTGGSGGDSVRNAVAGIFKQELNDLARQNPNVLVAAATNELSAIDPSLIRSGRFDHIYEVALPDTAALGELFASNIARRRLELETGAFRVFADDVYEGVPAFAAEAEGLSGADVVEIFRRLCFDAAMHQVRTGEARPINQADLLRAINDFE